MDEKREIRNTAYQVQVTGESEEKRTVEGYAILFNTPSDGLYFEEVIERGALDGVLEKSDVFALLNHSQSRGILARSNNGSGSLSLNVDEKGLKYRFEAPKTALGDELLENIRRGEISASSFCFDVEKDTWEKKTMELGSVQFLRSGICMMFLLYIMPHTARLLFICAAKRLQKKNCVKRQPYQKNIIKILRNH